MSEEKKIWYWQHSGISIGSSASTAIANLVLKVGETRMLAELGKKVGKILHYKRYIDDIICMLEVPTGKVGEWVKDLEGHLNSLDSEGGCVKVEGKGIEISRERKEEGEEAEAPKELEFLDVLVKLGLTKGGFPFMETGIYRKSSAADMYIEAGSHHPKELKVGMMRGEKTRFLKLCSTEAEFKKAWKRFAKALESRGYTKEFVEKAGKGVEWEDRRVVHRRMEQRKEKKAQGKEEQEITTPVIVPHRPGVEQWWKECRSQGLVSLEKLGPEEKKYLPKKLTKCLKGTARLNQILRKGRDREEGE